MAVINVLKDGTVVEDISTVKVPEKLVEEISKIYLGGNEDGKRTDLRRKRNT